MNYYQPYNQFQNPSYSQPYNSLAQPIQYNTPTLNNTPGLNGRFVNAFDEIKPDEIPMNGTQTVFIKNDLSQVCIKKWSSNGTIDTVVYELKKEEKNATLFDNIDYEILEDKLNKMDTSFSKRLDRLERLVKKNDDE